MNLGKIIVFIAKVVAIFFAVKGEWGWAIGIFLGGVALGALANMLAAMGMRTSLRDSDDGRS